MWSIIVVGATWCHCFERLSQITPHHWPNTSSTAQGGGGSFKHRKPIGEVGCCESGMAERSHWWIEWWLMSPLFLSLFLSFSDYLSTYLPTYLSFYLSISLSLCLSVYLFICLYILIIYLSICKIENEAILRDVLKFWTWQHQKRSNSARLPQSLNLTTSKTKQFCETSSFFKVDNIQNEAILRDIHNIPTWQRQKRSSSATFPHFSKLKTSRTKQFCETSFKNGKLRAALTASYHWVLRFFQSICLNYTPAMKKWCQVTRNAAPATQNHLSKSEDLMLQNATPLKKSPPRPPNSYKVSLVLRLPRKMHLQMSHACHCFWKCWKTLTFCSLLRTCAIPCACHAKAHLNLQKWRKHVVLCTFWLRKCASRHNGVHFFDISTSKSGPNLVCFCTFWLRDVLRATKACTFDISTSKSGLELMCFVRVGSEICFAPQRHALFRHRNFQKWSEPGVLCACWLRNALRATTACTFSTS